MALISIKIQDLKDARDRSDKVAQKAEDYSDALEKQILSKINSYSGSWTSNMTTAQTNLNKKRNELEEKKAGFDGLKADLNQLQADIVYEENRLTNRIEDIVGSYCNKYGLEADKSWWEKLAEFLINDEVLEWFKSIARSIDAGIRIIKNWYRYGGGREFVNAVGKVLLAVGAVVGFVLATIATFGAVGVWATIVAVAGLVTSAIALADSLLAVRDACKALDAAQSGDPVWARRYETHSNNVTLTGELRRQGQYTLANVIDVVNVVCSIIEIADFGVNLVKGFKKLNGKNLVDKGKDFFKTLKTNFKANLSNFDNPDFAVWYFFGDTKKTLKTVKNGIGMLATGTEVFRLVSNGDVVGGLKEFGTSAFKTVWSTANSLAGKNLIGEYLKDNATNMDFLTSVVKPGNYSNAFNYQMALIDTALQSYLIGDLIDEGTDVKVTPADINKTIGDIVSTAKNGYESVKNFQYTGSGNISGLGSASSFGRFTNGSLLAN